MKKMPIRKRLVAEEEVAKVDADSCSTEREATWGIVRTSTSSNSQSGVYTYSSDTDGSGTYAYVIDTGIYLEHSEFEGRAIWGIDVMSNNSCKCDSHGHGTHVAGTIMSKAWGIAKGATAVAIRVLDAEGYGTDAGVIEGIEFAVSDGKNKRAVANMSLGGDYSSSLNDAVTSAISGGMPFIAAAGNEDQDACNTSPSSTTNAITVTASDFDDNFCDFSNYGSCTNIIAPGSAITSAWIGGQYSVATASGTSMASPHVAGVICKLLTNNNMSPSEIYDALQSSGGSGYISNVTKSNKTPNVLLHDECSSAKKGDS